MPREYKILLSIAAAAIIVGVLLFKFAGTPTAQAPLTARPDAYSEGVASAPITVTEFADLQCPACKQASAIPAQLLTNFSGKVKIVFRHFPLTMHPFSQLSAQAVEAAGAQGKFWEMYRLLYDHQEEWGSLLKPLSRDETVARFVSYAHDLKLNEAKFKKDLEDNVFSSHISSDLSAGQASGVNSTPQFFVNQTMITEPSYAAISAEIQKQLSR